ncbi:MAG: hypothetical protein AAF682_03530 [Planctomycetota bacterium]
MLLATLLLLAQDPGAQGLLRAAQDAYETQPRVEYEGALVRAQVLTWTSHTARGTVALDPGADAFRVDVSVEQARVDGSRRITLMREGERYVFVDHDARTWTEGAEPGIGGLPSRLAYDMAQLFPAAPSELLAAEPGLGEPTKLGERDCETVTAQLPEGPTAHVWHVDSADRLPRLWRTKRDLGGGDTIDKQLTVRTLARRAEPLPAAQAPADYARAEPVDWQDPEDADKAQAEGVFTELEGSVEPVREHFNSLKKHVRALGLFAPT